MKNQNLNILPLHFGLYEDYVKSTYAHGGHTVALFVYKSNTVKLIVKVPGSVRLLYSELCFKAEVCVRHSIWNMEPLFLFSAFEGRLTEGSEHTHTHTYTLIHTCLDPPPTYTTLSLDQYSDVISIHTQTTHYKRGSFSEPHTIVKMLSLSLALCLFFFFSLV